MSMYICTFQSITVPNSHFLAKYKKNVRLLKTLCVCTVHIKIYILRVNAFNTHNVSLEDLKAITT